MHSNTTKGHGFFRKSKAYGLVCGIALAGAMAFGGTSQVSADEVSVPTATEPVAVVTTNNPATNLVEAQPEVPQANVDMVGQAGTQTGALVSEVTSQELNSAVETAKEAGVEVSNGAEVTHDSLEKANADLASQTKSVEEATVKKEANTQAIEQAKAENVKIDAENKAETERVAQENEAGQKAVDAENAQKQAEAQAQNDKLKADYEAQLANVQKIKDENKAIAERNKLAQESASATNAQKKAEYDRQLAAYEKALADRGKSEANNIQFDGYGVSETLDSFGQRTSDVVTVDSEGNFVISEPQSDTDGTFANTKVTGKLNYTVSYDEATKQAIAKITGVSLNSWQLDLIRPTTAVNRNISASYKDLEGNVLYTRNFDGLSSIGLETIGKSFALEKEIILADGQTSSELMFLKTEPSWIFSAPSSLFATLTYHASDIPNKPQEPSLENVTVEPEKEVPAVAEPEYVTPVVVTFTPKEPTLKPHVPVPDVEMIKVEVHPVLVKQTPANVKAVVNEDGVSVDGKLVPKGSTAVWELKNASLQAGREMVTSYVMNDPAPAHFLVDMDATKEKNAGAWVVTMDDEGKLQFVATDLTLGVLNANRAQAVNVPVAYFVGSPQNDAGTYQNTFTTLVNTPKGEYKVVSNTPVIYTPGSDYRTYNGNVVVRYFEDGTNVKISPDQIDVEDGKVGSGYDTKDQKQEKIGYDGKTYVLIPKVVGSETGKVVNGTIYVDYFYKLVDETPNKGNVIVHYINEDGQTIKNDVEDTPLSDVETPYDTKDNKPPTITTEDGIEYVLVPEKTLGNEDGKVVEGTTEITYVYKRVTPKPATPTPDDNVIQPKKDVIDPATGKSINGQSVLPNSELNYVLTQNFDQYKGIEASTDAIAKGFTYIDDYLDEALDGKSMQVQSIKAANGDDVSQLFEMYHVLSQDALDEKLQVIVKESGISPVGEFYMWVAKNPQDFYKAYVQKGLDITYNLSFKIKDTFKEGDITNGTYQIDFGNGYYSNIVVNNLPKMEVHKDVLDKQDGKSINNGTVGLGEEATYRLEGWVVPTNRGYDLYEYKFVDQLQHSHDMFLRDSVVAKVDIKLADGTLLEKGSDLSKYTEVKYNEETGLYELAFKEDFLKQIPRSSEFGADVFLVVKRIASGEVKNEYTLYVNGNPVKSEVVRTVTPEPEKPVTPAQPEKPATPVAPAKEEPVKTLPNTGTETSIMSLIGGLMASLSGAGLFVSKRKRG